MTKNSNNHPNLYLKPLELKAVVMGLQQVEEDALENLQNVSYNWTPEARAILREMLDNSRSTLRKLANLFNDGKPWPPPSPYKPGDEEEFLTKES